MFHNLKQWRNNMLYEKPEAVILANPLKAIQGLPKFYPLADTPGLTPANRLTADAYEADE